MDNPYAISHVVNTAASVIALTITPLFLAMISQTKKSQLSRTAFLIIVLVCSMIYGVMGLALLAMLLRSLVHMWRGTP